MFQRVGPKAFKKDLKNIKKLLAFLGNPEKQLNAIHIAGTNGKGSCSFFTAALLHDLGFSVGLYTSPHYKDYRERIRFNKEMIPKSYVIEFINQLIEGGLFEQDLKPSFFEITVALAFQFFKDQELDYVVIETGLGGRLDSTNVIDPLVSLITNIGMDHTAFLGDSLELIAQEKAGIIKSSVPVIIGKTQPETEVVFRAKAKECGSKIVFADKQERIKEIEEFKTIFPDYQHENMYGSYYAMSQLIEPDRIKKALKKAWSEDLYTWGYVGRYMRVSEEPLIIFDSAHNQQGLEVLMNELSKENYLDLHIVLAVVSDKDLSKVLPMFPSEARYYFSMADIPRALDKYELQKQAKAFGLGGKCYSSVRKAFSSAVKSADKKDMILVTGSIFTVAEVV